jgi:hypothetical protein
MLFETLQTLVHDFLNRELNDLNENTERINTGLFPRPFRRPLERQYNYGHIDMLLELYHQENRGFCILETDMFYRPDIRTAYFIIHDERNFVVSVYTQEGSDEIIRSTVCRLT